MRKKFLGDSYDAVKRMWQDIFCSWKPIFANPAYIPEEIKHSYEQMTKIPILPGQLPSEYTIFNDPDTGIRLPGVPKQSESIAHISLKTIKEQLSTPGVKCSITYDQTNYRNMKICLTCQLYKKVEWLTQKKIYSFYYNSHAPFLFAFRDPYLAEEAIGLILEAGIPYKRINEITCPCLKKFMGGC